MPLYSPTHLLKNDFSIYSKPSRVLDAGNTVVNKTEKPMPYRTYIPVILTKRQS